MAKKLPSKPGLLSRLVGLIMNMSQDCRHAIYVWFVTAACLSGIMIITMMRQGALAESAVNSLSSILGWIVCVYLGADTVNRSEMLARIGDRIKDGPPPPQPPTQ